MRAAVRFAAVLIAMALPAAAQAGLHWVHSGTGGPIPDGAFVGGQENGAPLLVCRAPFRGGVYPGKLVKGNCNIAYDGHEIYTHSFDVLAGSGGVWDLPRSDFGGSFVAGYENGGPLFLCRAPFRRGVHPGKVIRDNVI